MVRPAQTARSERTREALRQAALVRFLAQGVEDTSAEQIAADAGVSLRTFYRHFRSKHDLLFADYTGLHWFRAALDDRPGGEPIHDVDYWKKGLRHSVYFTHGIRNAVDSGHTTFLELAPNPVALMQVGLTTASAGLHEAQLIPTLARKQDEVESMISTMAQLYVYGHDLDIWTLFTRATGPADYANIPPTRFKRKEHWLDVSFSAGSSSVILPGAHVALPDGRHVWEYMPRRFTGLEATDLVALVKAAAAEVLPDVQLAAAEQRALPGEGARLVTTLTRHPGGASVQVHARIDESFTLLYDALVTRARKRSLAFSWRRTAELTHGVYRAAT